MKIIILAAGIGSRLGKPHPKSLTKLSNGKTIMQNQLNAFLNYVSIDDIFIVVGFKKELIMEAVPDASFIYNDYFDTTNTSKSLLKALKKVANEDVIWVNGDVVFDPVIIGRMVEYSASCMAVSTARVGDEEVKYITDSNGLIVNVSKTVDNPQGEAVGINKVIREDISLLIETLEQCNDHDYFEKGIEDAISRGLKVHPIDISDVLCTEIDFPEDLELVNKQLENSIC